ncbi:hypothetical protein [Paenibacillus tyrfis]|uniref:hypothetical protein n=1 Tax=Paenibacillus tyrfis TaxID=1501230 RepID=UPI00209FFDBE|nr:hypothetical protein [Paenibacillus tyrfis]MCP1309870.1 hypothetical protein [Paenibacillus tyrfis]
MILGVVSATTGDSGVLSACYTVMHLLSTSSLRAVTLIPASGMDVWQQPDFVVNNVQLWGGIVLQVLSLAAMVVLSVWKPWGRRKQK